MNSVRQMVLMTVEALTANGAERPTRAVNIAANEYGVSTSTVWRWLNDAKWDRRLAAEKAQKVEAFRKLWGDASPSARKAILHELAGKKLPDGWTVTEGAA